MKKRKEETEEKASSHAQQNGRGRRRKQKSTARSLSLHASGETDDPENTSAYRAELIRQRQLEEHRREEEEISELYEVQSLLDSFYENVNDDDIDDLQEDEQSQKKRRVRKDYREVRFKPQPWRPDGCIEIGWMRVRQEGMIDPQQEASPVSIMLIERRDKETDEMIAYVQFYTKVQKTVTTRKKKPGFHRKPKKKPTPVKTKKKKSTTMKPLMRFYLSIDTDDEDADEDYRPGEEEEDEVQVTPQREEITISDEENELESPAELDDVDDPDQYIVSESIVQEEQMLGAAILLHPLAIVQTHRNDNSIDIDSLTSIFSLYNKGALSLSIKYEPQNHWFHISVALTPHAMSGDDIRDKTYKQMMSRVLMQWACDQQPLPQKPQYNHRERNGDALFNPHDIYQAALPPPSYIIDSTHVAFEGSKHSHDVLMDSKTDTDDYDHYNGDTDHNIISNGLRIKASHNEDGLLHPKTLFSLSSPITQQQLHELGIIPTLRPYQLRALNWMLQRELQSSSAWQPSNPLYHDELYTFWRECVLYQSVTVADQGTVDSVWYNTMTGVIALTPENAETLDEVRGGLLCEEMGLGKTVESLALFLAHPRPAADLHSSVSAASTPTADRQPNDIRFKFVTEDQVMTDEHNSVHTHKAENGTIAAFHQSSSIHTDRTIVEGEEDGGEVDNEDDDDDGEAEAFTAANPGTSSSRRDATANNGNDDETHTISCYCGNDDPNFPTEWICCDHCHTWQHCSCVGYQPTTTDDSTDISQNDDEEYLCPTCAAKEYESSPLPIKATLVCCPDVILAQWRDEIARHCEKGKLRVLLYSGVRGASDGGRVNEVEKMRKDAERRRREEEREQEVSHVHEMSDDNDTDAASPSKNGIKASSPARPTLHRAHTPLDHTKVVRPSQLR